MFSPGLLVLYFQIQVTRFARLISNWSLPWWTIWGQGYSKHVVQSQVATRSSPEPSRAENFEWRDHTKDCALSHVTALWAWRKRQKSYWHLVDMGINMSMSCIMNVQIRLRDSFLIETAKHIHVHANQGHSGILGPDVSPRHRLGRFDPTLAMWESIFIINTEGSRAFSYRTPVYWHVVCYALWTTGNGLECLPFQTVR